MTIYRRRYGQRHASTVTIEEARRDVRVSNPLSVPWIWIGRLCDGRRVYTDRYVYALTRWEAERRASPVRRRVMLRHQAHRYTPVIRLHALTDAERMDATR